MLNIIFFVTMYPILFIIFFVLKMQYNQDDNHLFSVFIEKAWIEDEAVKEIVHTFKKQMNISLIILMFTPLLCLCAKYESIQFSIWMLWLMLMLLLLYVPFPIACHKLKQWKRVNHLYKEKQMDTYSEIKNAGHVRRVTFLPFFIPTVVSVLLAVIPSLIPVIDCGRGLIIGNLVIAACTALFWGMAFWMDKQPVEVISLNSDINVNFTRAKKNVWKNFWIVCCWMNTIFVATVSLSLLLNHSSGLFIIISATIYCILLMILCIPLMKSFKNINKQYSSKRDFEGNDNNDNNWIGGIFYYNPRDHRSLVEKSVGIGTTVNMATPLGKGLTIIGVLAMLIIPLSCVFVLMEEFTPIALVVEDDTLKAEHIKVEYEIPIEDIKNAALLKELPSMSKSNGSAMDVLKKGDFYIRGQGHCQVLLNPQNNDFITFTANGETYFVSGFDDEQTNEVYQEITK